MASESLFLKSMSELQVVKQVHREGGGGGGALQEPKEELYDVNQGRPVAYPSTGKKGPR